MRFCPVCAYYMSLRITGDTQGTCITECKHCGHTAEMNPTSSEEALILELTIGSASGQKQTVSQLNDFTKLDPTLPRLKTIACPNAACPTQSDPAKRDILYIKTDAKNLKYQYSCTVCNTQWGS